MTCADKSWVDARGCLIQKARALAAAVIRTEATSLAEELETIAKVLEAGPPEPVVADVQPEVRKRKTTAAATAPAPSPAPPGPVDPKEPPFGSPDQATTPNATAEAQRQARKAREEGGGKTAPAAQTPASEPAAAAEPAKAGGRTPEEWDELGQSIWNATQKAEEVDIADIRLRLDIAEKEGMKPTRVTLLREELAKKEKALTGGLA